MVVFEGVFRLELRKRCENYQFAFAAPESYTSYIPGGTYKPLTLPLPLWVMVKSFILAITINVNFKICHVLSLLFHHGVLSKTFMSAWNIFIKYPQVEEKKCSVERTGLVDGKKCVTTGRDRIICPIDPQHITTH